MTLPVDPTLLTERQLEVALLVADGLTDKQIAAALHISDEGVAKHIERITVRWSIDRGRNIRVQIANRIRGLAA